MKRYNKYKPSGIEWAGEVPEHWEVKRGKFCTKLISGFPFDSGKFSYDENDMPLIRIRDIMNGQTEAYYEGSYPEESVVKKGELLIGMDGDFNIARWSGRDGLLNQRVCKLVSTDKLNENYAFYLLERPLKCINDVTYATTVKHLSTFDIYESFLPVPPLAEQEAIAAYLDARCADIDKVVATQQKRIALLQELKQSEITQAVTRGLNPDARMKDSGVEWIGMVPEHWEIQKIKFSFDIFAGATPKTDKKDYWDGDIVWVTPADYKTEDKYIIEGQRTITKEGYDSCNTQVVPVGSIIFSKRAPIGTVAINKVELCTNQGCLSCVPKGVNSVYYYYVMSMATEFFDLLGSGATFKEISADSFANVKLPCPNLAEQLEIVEYLDRRCGEIDKQIRAVTKQIELLREYKQALITEVVTGKRRV